MLDPPDEITLEEASDYDEKTGVYHPRPSMVGPKRERMGRLTDHVVMVTGIYAIVCSAGSWYV